MSGVRRISSSHLEAVGFERVPMVEEVGQFSVRGGIFDIYGFGMADPARLEFWGDEIAELRHFDLLTQRSTRPAEVVVVLPVDGAPVAGRRQRVTTDRVTLPDLLPPDTIVADSSGRAPRAGAAADVGGGAASRGARAASRRGCPSTRGALPAAGCDARPRWPPSRRSWRRRTRRAPTSDFRSGRRTRSIATSAVWRASRGTACRR